MTKPRYRLTRSQETEGIDLARDLALSGRSFGEIRDHVALRLDIPTRVAHRVAELGMSVARYVLRGRAAELVGAGRVAELEAA